MDRVGAAAGDGAFHAENRFQRDRTVWKCIHRNVDIRIEGLGHVFTCCRNGDEDGMRASRGMLANRTSCSRDWKKCSPPSSMAVKLRFRDLSQGPNAGDFSSRDGCSRWYVLCYAIAPLRAATAHRKRFGALVTARPTIASSRWFTPWVRRHR
jgi:hypothetical protein